MKYLKLSVILLAAAAAAFSCKSQYEVLLNSNDVDAKYKAAMDYFNQGKFNKAAQLFESLSVLTSGTERDDTVQYYWGLSNYRYKDYYTAETNFTKFLETFPRSPFAEEARFLRIDCLYRATYRWELDQTPTKAAITSIMQYTAEYTAENPRTEACRKMLADLEERLDRKEYENAKLYYRIEDYKASRVAFKNVLKEDADNIYREDILYYTAMSSYKFAHMSVEAKQKERYLTFVDDYYNFVGEYPESQYRRELDVMYKRSQKALGKWTGSDDELDVKDKEFEKERKQLEKAAKKMEKSNSKKNETATAKQE